MVELKNKTLYLFKFYFFVTVILNFCTTNRVVRESQQKIFVKPFRQLSIKFVFLPIILKYLIENLEVMYYLYNKNKNVNHSD